MKEDNNILEQLPLLKQLSSEELKQFTLSYKSILTLAKVVLPLLIIAILIIFIVYASKFSSFNPLNSDLIGYIILLCIPVILNWGSHDRAAFERFSSRDFSIRSNCLIIG